MDWCPRNLIDFVAAYTNAVAEALRHCSHMHTHTHTPAGKIFQNCEERSWHNELSIAVGGSGAVELGKFLHDDANKRYKRERVEKPMVLCIMRDRLLTKVPVEFK